MYHTSVNLLKQEKRKHRKNSVFNRIYKAKLRNKVKIIKCVCSILYSKWLEILSKLCYAFLGSSEFNK
jgi:hypothetical protein